MPVSLPVALDIRQRTRSFAAVETWDVAGRHAFCLTGDGDPQDVQYAVVSAGLEPSIRP